jgi:predicted Ser/Thr protein kinase
LNFFQNIEKIDLFSFKIKVMADYLMNESDRVNNQLDSMRQFVDDLNALNVLARERSNHDIIHHIHQENPQIREIQAENRQLKASIEEHQRAMELIMTKYRQHTQQQINDTKLDFEKLLKMNEGNNVSSRLN